MHARVPPAVFWFDVFLYCVYDEVDAKKSNSVDVARMLQPDGKGEYSLWEKILVQTVFAGKRTGN